jgi:hypothetical protein
MFWPWLVSTVLATAVEAVIDGWILSRVKHTGLVLQTILLTFSQASFVPESAFILTLELLFLVLQVFKHQW